MVTLMKAGLVFGLLAITVKMLRRFDGRAGSSRRRRRNAGAAGAVKGGGRAWGRNRRPERVLDVVERAPLGRSSSVVLVRVRDQHFVLGVTDQAVAMLLEVDLPDDDEDAIDLRHEGSGQRPAAALSLGELVRQAKLYLPGRSRIELVDVHDALGGPARDVATADVAAAGDPAVDVPAGAATVGAANAGEVPS